MPYGMELVQTLCMGPPVDDEGAFLYLMPHSTLPAFKIGVSCDPQARMRSIGRRNIAESSGLIFRCESPREAFSVERHLHKLFKSSRFRSEELPRGGRTEWFCKSVFDRVVRYLRENDDLLPIIAVADHDEYRSLIPSLFRSETTEEDVPRESRSKRRNRSYQKNKKLVQAWADRDQVEELQSANINIPELIRIAIREAHARLKKEAV